MPEGTRVHRCVEKLKGKRGINAYAVCQSATHQGYQSGKPLKSLRKSLHLKYSKNKG